MKINSKSTVDQPSVRLVLMSKNQQAFSRLSPILDVSQRAILRQFLLIRQMGISAISAHQYFAHDRSDAGYPISLWSTPGLEDSPAVRSVIAFFGVREFAQHGTHLGERMINAITDKYSGRSRALVLMGIDSPSISVELIHQCVLQSAARAWVFVPALDGGFVLCVIGTRGRGATTPTPPQLALGMRHWSHDKVLQQITEQLSTEEFFSTAPLPDIDVSEDFQDACNDGTMARALYLATRILNAAQAETSASNFLAEMIEENTEALDLHIVGKRLEQELSRLRDTRLAGILMALTKHCRF